MGWRKKRAWLLHGTESNTYLPRTLAYSHWECFYIHDNMNVSLPPTFMCASKPMEYRLVETHSAPRRKRNSKWDANIVNKFLFINKFHHINNGPSIGVSTSGKKCSHILLQYILYQKPALSILPFSATRVRLNRLKSSELFPSGKEMINLCSSEKSLVLF